MSDVKPGDGWRLLNKGEILRESDEVVLFNGGPIGYKWLPIASWLVGESCFFPSNFRRRTSDWVKTSERLPTKEDGDVDQQILVARDGSQFVSFWHTAKEFSLWRKLPPLPQPETSDEAFAAEFVKIKSECRQFRHIADVIKTDLRRFWNAGVEWQKKQTQNQTPQ